MKKIFFIFLLIIYSVIGISQSVRFNKFYEIKDTAIWSSSIIQTDTGYIVKGNMTLATTGYQDNKTAFFNFDNQGNLLKWEYYGDPNYVYWQGGKLIKDKDGNYFTAGGKEKYDGSAIYLFKFNSNLDTLWEKSFFPLDSFPDVVLGCNVDNNNNYLIYGGTFYDDNGVFLPSNSWYNPFILKVDSNGNFIYHHIVTQGLGYLSALSIDENNHYWASGAYIGLYYLLPTIFECDSNSHLLWSNNFGPIFFDDPYDANSLFIYHSSYDSTQIIYGAIQTRSDIVFHYNEPYLAKIKNHQIAWDLYGTEDSSMVNWINTIKETTDHNLILVGNNDLTYKPYSVPYDSCQYVDSTGISEQLLKLTSDGNCLWRRRVFVPGLKTDSINIAPFARHIIQTDDNGYCFVGNFTLEDSNFNLHYKIWLVKTDSLGCDGTSSCSDTAMVLNLLSAPDSICSNDTTWLTFEINGLSAPFTISSTENIQISNIYYIKDPYYVFATDTPTSGQIHFWFDTSRVVPNHLYQQFPIIANTTDSIYTVTITLQGYYERTISHTYNFFVKDCGTGNQLQKSKDEFSLYPNPSTGNFTINLPDNSEVTYITIANATGQIIKIISLNKGQTTYQFKEKLPAGVYFVGVDSEKGMVVKKIIVD